MLKGIIILVILVTCGEGIAQNAFTLSGKLRLLNPLEIRVESLKGDILLSLQVAKDGGFKSGPKEIEPDLYILLIGNTKQPVYLTNTDVTIKGFYDEKNPDNSSLSFTGIDDFLELLKWVPERKKTVVDEVRGQLQGTMYSALAYMADMKAYEPNKMLLDLVPEANRGALSAKWLENRVDSLRQFAIGTEAYDFEYVDPDGKNVRLSDFRGKYVLVDFWASWCGACRATMPSIKKIYTDYHEKGLEVVSISLDDNEKTWEKA